jgi:hypothetical protein
VTLILWAAIIMALIAWPMLLVAAIPLGLFYVFSDWHFGTAESNPDRHNRTI